MSSIEQVIIEEWKKAGGIYRQAAEEIEAELEAELRRME